MAKLVMTIDSDQEIDEKIGKKQKKPLQSMKEVVKDEDEQMLLSSDVLLNPEGGKKVAKAGSTQMWKFKDSVVLGKHS